MMKLTTGSRVVAVKEVYKRSNHITIYGRGNISKMSTPSSDAIGYASELTRKDKLETWYVELDENDVGNEYVYGTECLLIDESIFDEAYSSMHVNIASIVTDRYRYWDKIKKQEEGKLP